VKLARHFYRLPVRFDVERLRAEIEALPADAWSRHPSEYEGNTAARLITVGGTQNDSVGGEMQPTQALLSSPYLQQVLASFATVWSRSRLMQISGGGSVPQHSDMNYHWYHRVRVHIPVITRPEVRFHCADQSVHMAAGEAWIFDNWREHKVLNPTNDARIHLVADTAGTSEFWRLVAQGQVENFGQLNPVARLVAFDPTARPKLLIERFNVAPLMPPAEVEQLAFDLLADVAPADARPESVAAVGQFTSLIVDFCHDWRSLWYLSGDAPEARKHYEKLLGFTRQKLGELPPLRVASTGYSAQAVLNARLLAQLFGDGGGARREAAEFNVAAAGPGRPARARIETGSTRPAVSETPPAIERPIIILSAPRAGSTLLFETLAQAAGIFTIGGESHALIESIAALRPGRGIVTSNRLTRKDATSAIVEELRLKFAARLRDRDGLPPSAVARLLEKTPKNALRVPFFLEVFPDARFVFLHREPRANLSSMMQAWRAKGWVTYRQLPGWPGPWSLLLPPGYERLQGRPLEEIVAYQWRAANETILDDLESVARDCWTSVSYEDLIRDPRAEVERLLKFAGLAMDPRLDEYLSKPLPLSRHTKTAPAPDKWRQDEAEIERVLPGLSALSARVLDAKALAL
jgi:sulfotransferase family protein/aspartyl/asparaginyl beta-hydroxylase